jgi:hypothetical protein
MIGFPLRRPLKRLAHTLHRGRRSAAPSNRHRCRLVLESLEGRWVPSTVTNLNDAGAGSLRQAILDTPAGGIVDFQPGLSGTITLSTSELLINKDLTIAGPGADVITVSGAGLPPSGPSREFYIPLTSTVQIAGLTIAQGHTSGGNEGGGVDNAGTLTLSRCAVAGNSTTDAGGGGIANAGTLTITDSTISGNSANSNFNDFGGGLYNTGTAMLLNSTVSGNTAGGRRNSEGGGIDNSGTLTITSSTLSGNTANFISGIGGAIFNSGTLTVTSSTVSGNLANGETSPGGGLVDSTGHAATLKDTIVAHNTDHGGAPDVSGSVNSQGHNLIGSSQGGSGYADTDLLNLDPRLGPLADNGGPTFTMALLPGSPAIDAGDNTDAPMWDQRGPGFRRIVNGTIDIGAFEVQAHAHNPPTGQPLPSPVPVQALATLSGPLLGQPADLPGDPAPGSAPGLPDGPAGQADPAPVPTAEGPQAADAWFATAGDGLLGAPLGPPVGGDLGPSALNPVAGS